jgi:hypothetical protein
MRYHASTKAIQDEESDYDGDVLIDVQAIAEYICATPQQVTAWIRHEGLPVFRLGEQDRGPWYAHVYAIDGWILNRRKSCRSAHTSIAN